MKAWAFAVLELNCRQPDFWDLTPAEYEALTNHWRVMMRRQGFKVPAPDTPENRKAIQDWATAKQNALKKK